MAFDFDPARVANFEAEGWRAYYERFYRLAARFSGLQFDPARVAALELRYNDVHRRLVGQLDKQEFVQTMVELHAALFGITAEQARESAEARVLAANIVDGITSHTSSDVAGDWVRIEEALRHCYASIRRAQHAAASNGTSVSPAQSPNQGAREQTALPSEAV